MKHGCPYCQCPTVLGNRVLDPLEYDLIAGRLLNDLTLTYEDVASEYGVTRERIRQVLPPGVAQTRRARRKLGKKTREQAQLDSQLSGRAQRALDNNLVCVSCGGWILRGGGKSLTCSPDCAEAWLVLRNVDNPDEHRQQEARVYLANPDKYAGAPIEWARRMVSDNPPPRNRTYLVPGSKRATVIRKYRPELYDELVSA